MESLLLIQKEYLIPPLIKPAVCSVLHGVPACLGGPSVCGGGPSLRELELGDPKEKCEGRTLGYRGRMDSLGRRDWWARA